MTERPDPGSDPVRIGPYKILRPLGEGGMGVVYEAEQTAPVHRRVALKIIKLGMDTRQVVARFDAERQALAVMDHPNIAKVLDVGATEAGRPYFVMELVKGTPLTDYADTHKLSTEARLRLFIPVCEAVQHAHQKGVIHRDLKPSNVLVTVRGGEAVPKVIDFGIAKAVEGSLTERTLVTRLGQLVGTPEYMSPEQAEMSGLDVDTRTDIYSLGVMLYELLVGALPFELRGVGESAIRTTIREKEPPTPSSRLTTLPGDARETIARYRHTDPAALTRQLEGDLDWVLMKCLEKDRTRRYETANGLALELGRYLAHEPVRARPPSTAYRMRKFVRRNRAGVLAAAVALLAVAAGTVGATVGMVRARRAEAEAVDARARVEREAETARQTSDFLVGLFSVSDPGEARGNSVTARELLDKAARSIEVELADQPAVRARLMRTIGEAYRSLGLYADAAPMLQRSLDATRAVYGDDHLEVADGLAQLGRLFRAQGRYDEAGRLYRRALEIREGRLGPDHPEVAATLDGLANAYTTQGKFDEAEPLLERALAIRRAALPPADPALADSWTSLGTLLFRVGRYPDADSAFRRALETYEAAHGEDHPDVANALSNLGGMRWQTGRTEDAQRMFERSLAIRTRVLGASHPDLADILNNLGVLAWTRGDYPEAGRLYGRALAIYEASVGPEHPLVAAALNNLAETRWKLREFSEAEPLFRRALAIKERAYEAAHPSIAITLNGLAGLYRDQRRFAEAEPLYRRALQIRNAALGPTDASVAETIGDYAAMLRAAGREAEAAELEARAEPNDRI